MKMRISAARSSSMQKTFSALAEVVLFGVAAVSNALPCSLSANQSITTLTTAQIDSFNSYTHYASAAYCTPAKTLAWNCGANCDANPGFRPVAAGGNGDSVQYWYVGYDPDLDTAIVAHQGTNPSEMLSLATDADFFLEKLNCTLFPGLDSDIEVHSGFADEQARTATDVLAAVEKTMSEYGTTSVTMVGHSLGAAISLLDSVYLPLWLPVGTTFQTIVYGLPRVGNQAFADHVDAAHANANANANANADADADAYRPSWPLTLAHVNNKKDPIPICPGMFAGFVHPSGEVHVNANANANANVNANVNVHVVEQDSGEQWASCPGQDNPSAQCVVGDVPEVWDGNLDDHDGPYNGIMMGC